MKAQRGQNQRKLLIRRKQGFARRGSFGWEEPLCEGRKVREYREMPRRRLTDTKGQHEGGHGGGECEERNEREGVVSICGIRSSGDMRSRRMVKRESGALRPKCGA